MITKLFSYPLPNYGNKYCLTEEQLRELLWGSYNQGYQNAMDAYSGITTSTNGEIINYEEISQETSDYYRTKMDW